MIRVPAGIYIHVPFCRAKCPYCDFYSITDQGPVADFIAALLAELELRRDEVGIADTIYFGGGTPSLLAPGEIARILEQVRRCFEVTIDAEVTLEVNPGTVNTQDLAVYRSAGINRLNVGLQSTDDRILRMLGRIHTAKAGIDTYHNARSAGFDNLGLDLIYAVPGQTLKAWEAQMAGVVRLAPDHLSCYTLTVEPGTPMAQAVDSGQIRPLDERLVGQMFDSTADFLNPNGYRQYEVSNYARQAASDACDYRSRHNRKYWTFTDYLGFGPAAHSFRGHTRWWNYRQLAPYLADLTAGRLPVAARETLTVEQRIIEFVYLGLRQTDGIDHVAFSIRFEIDFEERFGPRVIELVDQGLVERISDRIRLTARGMRFLESVADRLLG